MNNAVQWCPDSRYYTDYPRLIAPVIRATDRWRVENFDLMLEVLMFSVQVGVVGTPRCLRIALHILSSGPACENIQQCFLLNHLKTAIFPTFRPRRFKSSLDISSRTSFRDRSSLRNISTDLSSIARL